ncbi:ABC transporter substrate-binding protein [Alsobacter sp. SYSU M60028]|uniref:ABC transporter substrate-binding protein n=1 Tax=Alsobacter ponti TaxID=2962936 RepID=A0ABT1LG31_9HYPH|nr:ABC transporter substrate-binding protein [Alsobacter ponti]MCP8940455.1 ABC transporter substrate-binding protein [Alsobacter ponti]
MFSRRTLLRTAAGAALAAPALHLASPARAAQRLRVGIIPILGAAPVIVLDKEGWAKQAGLDLQFITFESGPNMIQALASGTLDIYVAGVAPLAVARAKGIDIRVVTATAVEELVMVAGGKLAGHFKQGVSPAQAFAAFRKEQGKAARLATQPAGSVPNTTMQYWLWEVAKADKADVEIVPMGIDATQQALLTGAVDGATVREPAVTIITKRDPRTRIVALGGEMFPNQPGTVVALTGALVQGDPKTAQAIVDMTVRAVDLIQKDPDRVAPHVEAVLGKGIVDTATIRAALVSPASKFIADPGAIVDATRLMQAYQVKLGSLDKEYPLEGLFDSTFYGKARAG